MALPANNHVLLSLGITAVGRETRAQLAPQPRSQPSTNILKRELESSTPDLCQHSAPAPPFLSDLETLALFG